MKINKNKPNHIAIIMDGNGTWSKLKNLERKEGHKKGVETAKKIIGYYLEEKINMPKLYFKHIKNICSKNKINPKLIDLLCFEEFIKLARGRKWTDVKPKLYEYVSKKLKKG